jgi:uncharacterized OsmC-like protein
MTGEPTAANGVDLPNLLSTIETVRRQRELAAFRFRATNRWVIGTHSRTTIETFTGAGAEHSHIKELAFDADHPQVLVGADQGATPVEFLLHALGACMMAGVANMASLRGVVLDEVEATIEGDLDVQGLLGLSDEVRNGYQQVRVSFRITGDAPPEVLEAIVAQSQARSAVFDVLTNGVDVTVAVDPTSTTPSPPS